MLQAWASGVLLLLSLSGRDVHAIAVPVTPPPADVLAGEGLKPHSGIQPLLAAPPIGTVLPRTGWTVACDSAETGNECNLAIDGDTGTFWHTVFAPPTNAPLPHTITVDMKSNQNVNGVAMLPRQDGNTNGFISQHKIYLSTDGTNFGSPVAFGTWFGDAEEKFGNFETKPARYVRIVAITEAFGNPWTSIAELNVYAAATYTAPPTGLGSWGPTIDFPIVPVAVAVEPTSGNVLTWSSWAKDDFTNSPGGMTLTATYNPASGIVSQRTVTNTNHDMFCPGISMDANGRVVVTGGNDAARTSIYDFSSDNWISGPNMQITRGYQASATCSDGRIFTIGGSWNGGQGGKNGEIYDPVANTWTLLPNCPVAPMLTNDNDGVYRQDNHGWLFGWKNKSVFQAGPSFAMNWYDTSGAGGPTAAGSRTGDGDAMCGTAVMYDAVAGNILAVGGSPNYVGSDATWNAHVITIGTPATPANVVQASNGLWFNRIFHNSVVLPNGNVFITGGQSYGDPFYDDNPQLTPEMWQISDGNFYKMLPNSIVRVYHSWAVLLPDATVLSGGGGLCASCSTNHFDAQVYTPQYLLTASGGKATRPVISSLSVASIKVGGKVTIKTTGAVSSCAMVRYGSATHTVNTDQRRIPLTLTAAGTNTYTVNVPTDPGIALPGYWMVFVMNSAGVPSVAKTLKVTLT
jgi:galactose oxidase